MQRTGLIGAHLVNFHKSFSKALSQPPTTNKRRNFALRHGMINSCKKALIAEHGAYTLFVPRNRRRNERVREGEREREKKTNKRIFAFLPCARCFVPHFNKKKIARARTKNSSAVKARSALNQCNLNALREEKGGKREHTVERSLALYTDKEI